VWPLTLSIKAAIFPVHSEHSEHSVRYALCGRSLSDTHHTISAKNDAQDNKVITLNELTAKVSEYDD